MILILADIDNFKQINDAYGHRAGDEVLVILAKQLGEAVRFDDIIISWGGEEFLLICPLAQKNYVEQIIAKIMNNVRKIKYSITDKKEIHVTVSIGAIYYPVVSDMPKLLTFEQAIDLCDKALYESKKNGKNQARIIIPNDKYIKENKKLNKISVDSFFNDKKSYIMKEVY